MAKDPTSENQKLKHQLKVEAALDKVRAKAMAMRHSDELRQTVAVIFKELRKLDFDPSVCSIGIYDKKTKGCDWWMFDETEHLHTRGYHMPYLKEDRWFREVYNAWKKQIPIYRFEDSGASLKKSHTLIFEKTDLKYLPESSKKVIQAQKSFKSWYVSTTHGLIELITNAPLSEEQVSVLQRFAQVIDFTYTRVDDLQKAEAQAREAQIEVALERVRSRSMSMRHSRELNEVAEVLFRQISVLNIKAHNAWVTLIDSGANSLTMWKTKADGKMQPEPFVNPGSAHPLFQGVIDAWKAGEKVMEIPMPKKVAEKINIEAFDQKLNLPVEAKTYTALEIRHRYGTLGFSTWRSINEDEKAIIQRFAKVFEQTYTRFLDLQKAEAQTREAQIEAALERIRARSMGMHKSEELSEVVEVIYKQVQALGFSDWACAIIICDDVSKVLQYWNADANQALLPGVFNVPISKQPVVQKQWKSWRKGIPQFSIDLLGKEKDEYTHFMLNETDHKNLPPEVKAGWLSAEDVHFSYSFMKYGLLEFTDVESFKEENFPVYGRFAKVFEQTYTRFLDLQKAEAQAREARIEAALERVRSRSMAMHKSDELLEVVKTLYGGFKSLNIDFNNAVIQLKASNPKDFYLWIGTADGVYKDFVHWPYVNMSPFNEVYKSWGSGKVFQMCLSKTETTRFFKEYFKLDTVPKERIAATKFVEVIELMGSYLKLTGVLLMKYKKGGYTAGEKDIVQRFSKVFEQTYTRFLDLQKAEAQAKEAQIETALERVRARTMAMHLSEELGEVAVFLNKEFRFLCTTQFFNCGYVEVDEEKNLQRMWLTSPEGTEMSDHYLPLKGDPVTNERFKAWKKQAPLFHQTVVSKALKQHIDFVSPYFGSKEWERKVRAQFPERLTFYCANFNQGYIHMLSEMPLNSEEETLLVRFTGVFKQAYIRFLDLQKAETQAREAQIEAAIERVRSRSMAMHKSEELIEVATVLYNELKKLDVSEFSDASIIIVDEVNNQQTVWGAELNPTSWKRR